MKRSAFHILPLAAALLACRALLPEPSAAHAFNYGAIRTGLKAEGDRIYFFSRAPGAITLDAPDESARRRLAENYFSLYFTVSRSGKDCPATVSEFGAGLTDAVSGSSQTVFRGYFECSAAIGDIQELRIHTLLFADLFLNFDHYVDVSAGGRNWQLVFNSEKQDYPGQVEAFSAGGSQPSEAVREKRPPVAAGKKIPRRPDAPRQDSAAAEAPGGSLWSRFLVISVQFIRLGIFHIWSGYDHIFFIFSIILLLRSVKKILILISAFTLAHSITLILAGLRIITLSQKIVDPLIALSIVWLAARNLLLLRRNEEAEHLSERWWTTFGFGLIHGLGFAGALLQASIPGEFFVPALVVFNVGIELGQVSILLVFMPLILQMDELRHRKAVIGLVSGAITLLALLWFYQRLV